jgi:hypothetical protein
MAAVDGGSNETHTRALTAKLYLPTVQADCVAELEPCETE